MNDSKKLQYGLSFVAVASKGLTPLVSTKLPFIDDSKIETFLLRFSTPIGMMVGQGDQFFTGLFGPFPVMNTNDWVAYTYSFFLLDVDIGTPRDEANLYTIGILFLPKNYVITTNLIEEMFNNFATEINSVKSLLEKSIFNKFIEKISESLALSIPTITETVLSNKNDNKTKSIFQDLPTVDSGESLIAVPWILHSVYHGLERASSNILGGSSNLLDQLADEYTGEILDRFHLLDKLAIKKDENAIKSALNLGIEHLEKIGEKVKLNPVSENKFELSIECAFADAVHPYLPLTKCLWIKYLAAIVSKVLPPEKQLFIYNSEFDEKGSITFMEIKNKQFVTIK